MSDFIMKPKNDYAFKELMTNENTRIGFLSAMLGIDPKDIKETRILNTFLRKEYETDKLGILDVRILLNSEMEIDVEIQLAELAVWPERSLFYISKMFTEQIEQGEDYNVLKKCVNISILDFKLFDDEEDFYSCFHLREDTRHTLYTDKIEFHVVELPKLPPELKDNSSDRLLWAKFINAERKEELEMIANQNSYIGSAFQHLEIISQDKQKRLEYEAREKAIRDHNQVILEAVLRGKKEGIEEGRKEGKEEGRKEGKEEAGVEFSNILDECNDLAEAKRRIAELIKN